MYSVWFRCVSCLVCSKYGSVHLHRLAFKKPFRHEREQSKHTTILRRKAYYDWYDFLGASFEKRWNFDSGCHPSYVLFYFKKFLGANLGGGKHWNTNHGGVIWILQWSVRMTTNKHEVVMGAGKAQAVKKNPGGGETFSGIKDRVPFGKWFLGSSPKEVEFEIENRVGQNM